MHQGTPQQPQLPGGLFRPCDVWKKLLVNYHTQFYCIFHFEYPQCKMNFSGNIFFIRVPPLHWIKKINMNLNPIRFIKKTLIFCGVTFELCNTNSPIPILNEKFNKIGRDSFFHINGDK